MLAVKNRTATLRAKICRMIAMYSRVHNNGVKEYPVPALDDLRAGRADTAQEAIARHGLQGHRGHRRAGPGCAPVFG